MITDLFQKRYKDFSIQAVNNSFFIQLHNLYANDLKSTLMDKVKSFPYQDDVCNHYGVLNSSIKKLCNERGKLSLINEEYLVRTQQYIIYDVFKHYMFDELVHPPLEKLSFVEILFRDTEKHLLDEIEFLGKKIPEYKKEALRIKELAKKDGVNYGNNDESYLKKAEEQIKNKKDKLKSINEEINFRLKEHNFSLSYHNGFFQKSTNPVMQKQLEDPFWGLVSNPDYKNVEKDMLEALDLYDSNGRDPALYATKAFESTVKIICEHKGANLGNEQNAVVYLNYLNSKKNGVIISNQEKEILIKELKIRNKFGHGPGSNEMIDLTHSQTLRFIHSMMAWIYSLSTRIMV